MLCTRMRLRALQGTIFAAAMMVAPWAVAHGSHIEHKHGATHHHRLFAERHRHLAGLPLRHHRHRMVATTSTESTIAERPSDGEARPQRAHLYRADYDAMEQRRRRSELDEHEATVTARLNLAELQKGRERDDEIARWKLQYGGVATG